MNYELIDLPRNLDRRGNLSVIEGNINVPFEIKRVYYIYDVPGGESRGSHAHRSTDELIVAVSGSFTMELEEDDETRTILLNKPYQGLLVRHGVWRTLKDFSSGAVVLVIASEYFDEKEYIRDYAEFLELQKKKKQS